MVMNIGGAGTDGRSVVKFLCTLREERERTFWRNDRTVVMGCLCVVYGGPRAARENLVGLGQERRSRALKRS